MADQEQPKTRTITLTDRPPPAAEPNTRQVEIRTVRGSEMYTVPAAVADELDAWKRRVAELESIAADRL